MQETFWLFELLKKASVCVFLGMSAFSQSTLQQHVTWMMLCRARNLTMAIF
jgi:hypothetical protein